MYINLKRVLGCILLTCIPAVPMTACWLWDQGPAFCRLGDGFPLSLSCGATGILLFAAGMFLFES